LKKKKQEEYKANILVVDDVLENVKILVAILRKAGYKVIEATSGLEAIDIAREDKIDIILLDIVMPEVDGFETFERLKKEPLLSSIPVIFLSTNDNKELLTKAYNIGGMDYIKKPYIKEEILARVQNVLKIKNAEKELESKVRQRTREMEDVQVHLVKMLGGIAEGHSLETYLHVRRVAEFTYKLARLYGMSVKEAMLLKNASYLHDIGKLGVKDYILHKNGKLTDEEFEEIKKHPEIGASILKDSDMPLFEAAKIVSLEHHERWDGKGYPNKLRGEEIHIYGRIVAIADVFDALSAKRSYKKPWPMDKILNFLKEMRGSQFDPKLIDIFFENVDEFLHIYNTNTSKLKLLNKEREKELKGKEKKGGLFKSFMKGFN